MIDTHAPVAPGHGADVPALRTLTNDDLRAALSAGWRDLKAAPIYGLFFAFVYVVGGIALYYGLMSANEPLWLVLVVAGFPLIAPFAAVGLYEVSHRRETGEPLSWGPVLGALRGQGDGQLPVMGVVVLLVFGFWIILARGLTAIFMGQSGIGFFDLGALFSVAGVAMVLVGTAIGAALALVLFSITAFSLPMLLDRRVDFVTAIITSLSVVRANPAVMARWAAIIVVALAVAMVPMFLGLFVVLPVLGHATWHLYRRALVS